MLNATLFLVLVVLVVYLLGRFEESLSYENSFNALIWSVETEDGTTTLVVVKDQRKIKTYKRHYDERLNYLNPGDEVFVEEGESHTIYHYLTKQTFTFDNVSS